MHKLVSIFFGIALFYCPFIFSAETNEKEHFLFVGNPGVGKSALVNALVGKKVFASGLSVGTGLTTFLQTHEEGNKIYIDTPGLADLEKKKQAAEEIEKALKMGGKYRLFFVLNLNRLRIMEQDLVTMELVLDAIQYPKKEFNIIINNVDDDEREMLQKNNNLAELLLILGKQKYHTESVIFISKNEDLKRDRIDTLPLEAKVTDYIYNHSKTMNIESKKVSPVEWDKYNALLDSTNRQIANLNNKIRSNNQEIAVLMDELKDSIQKTKVLTAEVIEVKADKNKAKQTIDDLQQSIDDIQKARMSVGKEIEGLKGEVAKAKKGEEDAIRALEEEKRNQKDDGGGFWETLLTIGAVVGAIFLT
jgi:GTP-binding protein EngB required for normal cell division